MLFETEVGGQRVVTDVTPPMGGNGRAPTPPELFASSVGAFVAHYCEREGFGTLGPVVETPFEKTEKPDALVDFRLEAALPKADRGARQAAVQRVAHQCIVHETLQHLQSLDIRIRDGTAAVAAARVLDPSPLAGLPASLVVPG